MNQMIKHLGNKLFEYLVQRAKEENVIEEPNLKEEV